MKTYKTQRGFVVVTHTKYPPEKRSDSEVRLIQESSAIGDSDDALDNPGSSYLWIGDNHHLNRKEVKELIERMQYWLDYKRLKFDTGGKECE